MTCPICGGAGFLRRDVPIHHPDFGRAIPCSCKIRERIALLVQSSGLGNSNQVWTLDNFPGDPVARQAAKNALAQKRGLWIFWSHLPGTGRTGILVALVRACWDEGVPALYQSVPAMLDDLRRSYWSTGYAELLQDLKQVPVLALDEFDRWHDNAPASASDETLPSWSAEKICQIIDNRYMHWDERLTVIATNGHPADGDINPLTSRFRDTLRSRIVHVGGKDLRPRARTLERNASRTAKIVTRVARMNQTTFQEKKTA